MNWLLLAAIALCGCTIEVKPINSPKKKHYTRHVGKTRKHDALPIPAPSTTPDLSRLAPVLRNQ